MTPPSTAFEFVVSDLLRRQGAERRIEIVTPLPAALELSQVVDGSPVRADLLLRGIGGGVTVQGEVRFTARHRCFRCLTEWEEADEIRLLEMVALGGDDVDYVLAGELLDLEPILRDAVILALPVLPLCRDDCAGLCPTCGADLNTAGACSGHPEDSASPFAELRDLLETQE